MTLDESKEIKKEIDEILDSWDKKKPHYSATSEIAILIKLHTKKAYQAGKKDGFDEAIKKVMELPHAK